MLEKEVFFNGLDRLALEYGASFSMNKDKSKQWYEHCKEMSDYEFNRRIDLVLTTIPRSPYMADLFKPEFTEIIKKEEAVIKARENNVMYVFIPAIKTRVSKEYAVRNNLDYIEAPEA